METVLSKSKDVNPVQTVSEEVSTEFTAKINETMEYGAQLQNVLNNSNLSDQNKVSLSVNLFKLLNKKKKKILKIIKNQIDTWVTDGNNLVPGLQNFYDFLDTLSLWEEAAFLHILIFLCLIFTVFNILAVLFGNEIVKYLKLESKFSSLGTFFLLRSKLQRYYLI